MGMTNAARAGSEVVNGDFTWIANFIGGSANDVLRYLYVRGRPAF